MPRDPADQARSVHPAMARTVLRVLEQRGGAAGRAGVRPVAELLERGAPVPERLHAGQLAALFALGPTAQTEAAERLMAEPPAQLAALPGTADLHRLAAFSALVEPWFHVGHRTSVVVDGHGLTFRHLGRLGRAPQPAETLFVAALYAAGTGSLAGRAPQVRLLGADGTQLPPSAGWGRAALRPAGWRLSWGSGTVLAPVPPVVAVRGWIARDPAGPWRLARAAELLGRSPRTVQRELAGAGTSFQAELLAVRLELAAQLIARTALPLAEVAAAAGFADHAHLAHRFRRSYGCAPSRYRAAGGPSAAAPAARTLDES
ncbi:AraC family transcriptional regulator [Kitasatospora sp. NPDC094015]|uniref:AraC family transcriptional regulator n=1 Tax=Kitasatospora sp. NPDC094015 TaxID=3155205 RepID=UPI003329C28D